MDPFSIGSRLFLPGYYCIGAFPENDEEKVPDFYEALLASIAES